MGRMTAGGWCFGFGAFGCCACRVDDAGSGESGGDAFSDTKDIFGENAMEKGEKGFVAG